VHPDKEHVEWRQQFDRIDFPALDAPLLRMILPGSRPSFMNVNSDEGRTPVSAAAEGRGPHAGVIRPGASPVY
jgi:hypothetical protein